MRPTFTTSGNKEVLPLGSLSLLSSPPSCFLLLFILILSTWSSCQSLVPEKLCMGGRGEGEGRVLSTGAADAWGSRRLWLPGLVAMPAAISGAGRPGEQSLQKAASQEASPCWRTGAASVTGDGGAEWACGRRIAWQGRGRRPLPLLKADHMVAPLSLL